MREHDGVRLGEAASDVFATKWYFGAAAFGLAAVYAAVRGESDIFLPVLLGGLGCLVVAALHGLARFARAKREPKAEASDR